MPHFLSLCQQAEAETILTDLPGDSTDIPEDMDVTYYLRCMSASLLHSNYLLAMILAELMRRPAVRVVTAEGCRHDPA